MDPDDLAVSVRADTTTSASTYGLRPSRLVAAQADSGQARRTHSGNQPAADGYPAGRLECAELLRICVDRSVWESIAPINRPDELVLQIRAGRELRQRVVLRLLLQGGP